MIFTETILQGAYIIDIEKRQDQRGFFARTWCLTEFEIQGLATRAVQTNISYSRRQGTVRGMHYQASPYAETKLIRCTRGAIYDVIIDLRFDSPTFKQWLGIELTSTNYRMLYVPEGFAHGFQTLVDDVEVNYQVSQFYTPEAELGLRYDDPAFRIEWPQKVQVISEKDRSWPDYTSDQVRKIYR